MRRGGLDPPLRLLLPIAGWKDIDHLGLSPPSASIMKQHSPFSPQSPIAKNRVGMVHQKRSFSRGISRSSTFTRRVPEDRESSCLEN